MYPGTGLRLPGFRFLVQVAESDAYTLGTARGLQASYTTERKNTHNINSMWGLRFVALIFRPHP